MYDLCHLCEIDEEQLFVKVITLFDMNLNEGFVMVMPKTNNKHHMISVFKETCHNVENMIGC